MRMSSRSFSPPLPQRSWRSRWISLLTRITALVAFTLIVFILGMRTVSAEQATPGVGSCAIASEPNDDVATALDLGTGAVCASAENPKGGQDLYRWTVGEGDATALWTMRTTSIPDQGSIIEVYRVETDSSGAVLNADKLLSVTGGDAASAGAQDLLWAPGVYYVGVATSGAGPYQLTISRGNATPTANDAGDHSPVDNALPVAGAFSLAGDRAGTNDVFTWTLDATDAQRHWVLELQGPVGSAPVLQVADERGNRIVDGTAAADGRFVIPDLGLGAGTYAVSVQSSSDLAAPYILRATAGDARSPLTEDEPNDSRNVTMPIVLTGDSATVTGRLALHAQNDADSDFYSFTVDNSLAGRYLDLRLLWQDGPARKMCLQDATGTELQCVEAGRGAAMHDLVLASGSYAVAITGTVDPDHPYTLTFAFKEKAAAGFEAEPNNSQTLASAMVPVASGAFAGSGRLAPNDRDIFRFTVTGEPQLWLVEAKGTGVSTVSVLDAAANVETSRTPVSGSAVTQIFDLYLTPGEHWIAVDGVSGDYTLSATPKGPPDPHGEREPNDTLDRSQVIHLQEMRNGRLPDVQDYDVVRFSLQNDTYVSLNLTSSADGQLAMRLDSGPDNVTSLAAPSPGTDLQFRAMLPPGDYSVWLNASVPSQDRYQFAIDVLDPFDVPVDLEPNDSAVQARTFPANLIVNGVADPLVPRGDADWYAIPVSLAGQQITVEYTPGSNVALWTAASGDIPSTTIPLVSGMVSGSYLAQLPPDVPAYVQVTGSGPYRIELVPSGSNASPMASPPTDATPGASPVVAPVSGVQAALTFAPTPVAAYWSAGQRLDGTLTLTNSGDQTVTLELVTKTGNAFWRVDIGTGQTPVVLAPGQKQTVPVVAHIAPDARADQPIYVAVQANDQASMRKASAFALITPDRNAPPLNSETYLPLPKPLLGGLDAAWTGLGATPVPGDAQDPAVIAQLFDQSTITGTGWRAATSELPQEITVQLSGDTPVPVVGFVLDPRGLDDITGNQLKDFDLELSINGQTFTPVLSGTLSVIPTEQSFVLEKAVPARFARLRVKSAQSASASSVALGEWKVIAQPGWQPSVLGTPVATPAAAGIDISGPDIGGHLVDMQPQFTDPAMFQLLVTADQMRQTLDLSPGAPISWVVGFHDDRAAQITGLRWQDPPGSDAAARFDAVHVEISLDSPAGPWTDAGTWTLDRANGDPTFAFAQPTWARFVRFSGVAAPAPGAASPAATPTDTKVTWELPDTVHIYERMPDDTYGSILGEWGASSSSAIYEQLVPPAAVALAPDAGNDVRHATILPLGSRLTNTAAVGNDEDWYQVDVPDGMGQLVITLRGDPTLDVAMAMFDDGGKQVKTATSVVSPQETTFTANVTAGKHYFLRVVQPPTSVIFAFDTSASIGPFVTTVYQGLGEYAAAVQPGKEVVNILPYGEQLLLPTWTDQPYVLQGVISSYPRTAGSSDSEGSMLTAMDALQDRDGTKVIVLITDAESSPTQDELLKLWPELATVKPRIFTIHIAGGDAPAHSTDLMQDWASVNNGEYVYVRNQGEMDIAFDRAATILRRPTVYSVEVVAKAAATPTPMPTVTSTPTPLPTSTPSPTATPEPTPTTIPASGSLQIVAPTSIPGQPTTAQVADNASVAIIFDTSGSMLQGLEGSTRADIAKQSLTQLVTQTIPPGTTVSLRTFGDTPDSCDTRLVVPAGPLDPAAMSSTIQDVPIVDLVRTPIGASLQQVAADLGTNAGPKIVVLVTDGEETCGGDPAAAIRALVASGIDVHVNIVGFALDDEQLKATFASWAQLGNGRYIDAGNAAELDAAVSAAVQPTFRVVDAQGMIVASGQVGGEPVAVPAGTYTVVVASNPEQRFTNVTISPEQTTTLELQTPSSRTVKDGRLSSP